MPLAQILLAGETLSLDRTRSQSERDDAADSIVREAQRLTGLVDNVLFFSRIEHHNVQTMPVPTDLAEVVADIVASVAPLAAGVSASVTYAVPPHLTAVLDRSAFRQVLYNLLDNAFKYGPPGQHVAIGAAVALGTSDRVRIWVDDEGPGIPRGQESEIFEPFVRLRHDPDPAVAGSGLGLAVVRYLVTNQGGRIWVDRPPTGRGSRFILDLARARIPALAGPSRHGNGVGSDGQRR
jgi:signal transduction histidine kinase